MRRPTWTGTATPVSRPGTQARKIFVFDSIVVVRNPGGTLSPATLPPRSSANAANAGFEGKRNPRDLFTGSDCLIAPAMQQAKQPFGTRLQFLARLTLNAGKHTANQPTRLAHLDDGNDCAILVQGDEGPAQVVRLGHQGTPSVGCSDDGAISSPPCPCHLAARGRWSRTLGSP